eukprot:scaffold8126_cov109-Isochrysis_galbana.AAC.2
MPPRSYGLSNPPTPTPQPHPAHMCLPRRSPVLPLSPRRPPPRRLARRAATPPGSSQIRRAPRSTRPPSGATRTSCRGCWRRRPPAAGSTQTPSTTTVTPRCTTPRASATPRSSASCSSTARPSTSRISTARRQLPSASKTARTSKSWGSRHRAAPSCKEPASTKVEAAQRRKHSLAPGGTSTWVPQSVSMRFQVALQFQGTDAHTRTIGAMPGGQAVLCRYESYHRAYVELSRAIVDSVTSVHSVQRVVAAPTNTPTQNAKPQHAEQHAPHTTHFYNISHGRPHATPCTRIRMLAFGSACSNMLRE